jgi:hypothetical protein
MENLFKLVKNHSYVNKNGLLVLGNTLELIFHEDTIDIYKHVDLDNIPNDYNFDDDYITTVYIK